MCVPLCPLVLRAVMKMQLTTIYRALDSAPGHCQSLAHLVSASAFEVRIFYTDEKAEVQKGRATCSRFRDCRERLGLTPSSGGLALIPQ